MPALELTRYTGLSGLEYLRVETPGRASVLLYPNRTGWRCVDAFGKVVDRPTAAEAAATALDLPLPNWEPPLSPPVGTK